VAPQRSAIARKTAGVPLWAGLLTIGLASTSIFALLADLYGVASMRRFFWTITVPSLVGLVIIGLTRSPQLAELQKRIRVGVFGGVIGTIGYDLIRLPFAVGGSRVFVPIDTYGILITGADMSSSVTSTMGWLFHLSNGVTFGIMYAVVGARRHWLWGVAWGLMLETAVFLTPFKDRYVLAGQLGVAVIAYAGHVLYGWPLGKFVQHLDNTDRDLRETFRYPSAIVLGLAVFAILLWQQPWHQSDVRREAGRLAHDAGRPVLLVAVGEAFTPEFARIRPGECVLVVNRTDNVFASPHGDVPAHGETDFCFDTAGVKRVKLGSEPFSGGFVYVDDT
jgi:hypothetical protein